MLLRYLTLGLAFLGCSAPAEPPPVDVRAPVDLLYAPHGAPGAFFNPWALQEWSLFAFLRWQFSANQYADVEAPAAPWVENDGSALSSPARSATVTWVGHATFAVHDESDVFLTDPHFGERAFLPKRLQPPGIPLESVPADAFAVISHNHYDHLDRFTVEALPDTIEWYVPLGMGDWFRDHGRTRVVELDWWQSARRGRWTITCLPSQHWTRRFEQGVNAALWCAWLLDSGPRRYYFAGDTCYFHGFPEFARRFGPIDVAMLPIGAYAPRWFMRYQHMNPAEAFRAFRDLEARYLLPMHWGTFDLTDEPPGLASSVLAEVVRDAGFDTERVRTLPVGGVFEVPGAKKGKGPGPIAESRASLGRGCLAFLCP